MTRPTTDNLAPTGRRYRTRHGIVRWTGPRPIDPPEGTDSSDECIQCDRILVASRRWLAIPIGDRDTISTTHAKRATVDLCAQCYTRQRRGGGPRRVAQCGTHSGYEAHRRRGEIACDACLTAAREYKRQRAHAKKAAAEHDEYIGTETGYSYHLRRWGTDPCDECREAKRIAERFRSERRRIERARGGAA